MLYLPTSCKSCGRAALHHELESEGGEFVCPFCGGTASVVPGCNYAEGDRPLFGELSQIVADARVAQVEAEQMAIDAHEASAAGLERQALERLGVRLRSLKLRGISESQQHKALMMLATILEALGLTKISGTIPTAATVAAGGSARG